MTTDNARTINRYARQAIETKYHGPTNTRGSRISARAGAGRIFVPYDHALDIYENHAAAARAFADRFQWGSEWVGGATADGYCFCSVNG